MSKYILELLGESEHDGFAVMQIRADGGVNNGFIVPEDVAHMLMHLVYPKQPEPRSPIDDMRDGVFRVRQGAKPLDGDRLPQDRERGNVRADTRTVEQPQPSARQPRQNGQPAPVEPVATLRREREPAHAPNSRAARAAAIGSKDGQQAEAIFDRLPNTVNIAGLVDQWTDDSRMNRDLVEREVAKVGRQGALRFAQGTRPANQMEAHIINAINVVAGGAGKILEMATSNNEVREKANLNLRTDTRDVRDGNPAGLILPDPSSYVNDADDDVFGAF